MTMPERYNGMPTPIVENALAIFCKQITATGTAWHER
jgi:hypothetical protein